MAKRSFHRLSGSRHGATRCAIIGFLAIPP
jgi:hypothetical protein